MEYSEFLALERLKQKRRTPALFNHRGWNKKVNNETTVQLSRNCSVQILKLRAVRHFKAHKNSVVLLENKSRSVA